jgi:AraC family transcriptional regulator, regulatory protein of adaptative response / methylated-DNA-[protein]-cysteine methyltransferase
MVDDNLGAATAGLARVVAACRAMERRGGPVAIAELAAGPGSSPRQLHRDFRRLLGASPREYGEAVRAGAARGALRSAATVAAAAFDAGYGSLRGFYEQVPKRLGMEPSRYAAGGRGERLRWSSKESDVGVIVAVASERGLAAVRVGDSAQALLDDLQTEFHEADLERDDDGLLGVMEALAALARGIEPETPLPVDVRGTAFQASVWKALREIPAGETRTYAQVAASLGRPTAVRAVAGACGANPVALVVPCHRVVRTDGGLGGYRWGLEVKAALLEAERRSAGRP